MKLGRDLVIRLHNRSDTERIVMMINRDPFHMLNGLTAGMFEQDLDEPGERIRDNTFVVELGQTIVGYFSLCFVEQDSQIKVYCYGTVDVDWRRRGIGTAMFKYIFTRLEGITSQESKPIQFIHRALTSIPGETTIGLNFGMQEQNSLEILCLKDLNDLKISNLPSEFQFRSPRLDDAESWADIYNDAFGGNKSIESVIHEFQGAEFSPNLYMICIHETGIPVGLICSTIRGTHARIPTIAVKREWQRRGLGEAMLSEILQRLKDSGAFDVRLSVESQNGSAKLLYAKFGFQQEYQRIHYVALIEKEEVLEGGNVSKVVRVGDTIRRSDNHNPYVNDLLIYLKNIGFDKAPHFLGMDQQGREILTFIPGEVPGNDYPDLTPYMWSDASLIEIAKLLRQYHDATRGFASEARPQNAYPDPAINEVVCHNDAAPYNIVIETSILWR
ncbi:GNAT family N-acetyltransferase [Paenibacillus mangrovi]|uniref:GNAT family N-acetyltransferase n=1 Tax=Paenibacillus mangrovi TaxID=2931978 RepID=UPI00313FE1C9